MTFTLDEIDSLSWCYCGQIWDSFFWVHVPNDTPAPIPLYEIVIQGQSSSVRAGEEIRPKTLLNIFIQNVSTYGWKLGERIGWRINNGVLYITSESG